MNEILIIIVIYNKEISNLHLLRNNKLLNREDVDLFVYDNSKLPQDIPSYSSFNIYYEHDENNSGVSRAYNQGAKKARKLGKKLLLILDQDSTFELSFIEKYMRMYQIYKNDFIYAPIVCDDKKSKIYSPAFMNNFVGKIQNFENFLYQEAYSLINKSVINSGLMIPLELFEKIGGYNEKLKLDFSDIYFIEKYKELNSKIILVDLFLKHSISGDEGKDFNRESNRFKYYCSSAKEIGKALKKRVFWSPFRRLLRLSLKYKNLKFLKIFYHYYLRGQEI